SEQAQLAEQQAQQAQHERDHALHELSYAEASDEFLSFLLQKGSDKPFTTGQLLARGEQLVDRQFADDPALRAHLLLMLADLYGQAMEQDESQALLLRAQAAVRGSADASLQASTTAAWPNAMATTTPSTRPSRCSTARSRAFVPHPIAIWVC
ncbi:MAG: hypothetical protein M3Y55_00400, partial [Pseudomonadota bacterium]|nr:hypothetical protein [Pseudomonadota bacterium]